MKNYKGFTLLEILAVVAILALMSLFLIPIYIDYSRLYARENAKIDLNLAKQTILNDLSKNIKGATAVLTTSTINGVNFVTGNQTLILSLPSIDNQREVISGSFDLLVYYLSTSTPIKLVKRVAPALVSRRLPQNRALGQNVNFLEFSYNTPDPAEAKAVVVTLANSRAVFGQTYTVTSTLSAVLRNK